MSYVLRAILIAILTCSTMAFGQNSTFVAGEVAEISCGTKHVCLTDEDLKVFVGKTVKYRHPSFPDAGHVYLTFRQDGALRARNSRSHSSGSWEIKDGAILNKPMMWDHFSLKVIKVNNGYAAYWPRKSGGFFVIPIEIDD